MTQIFGFLYSPITFKLLLMYQYLGIFIVEANYYKKEISPRVHFCLKTANYRTTVINDNRMSHIFIRV